jgi:hypothetical protein
MKRTTINNVIAVYKGTNKNIIKPEFLQHQLKKESKRKKLAKLAKSIDKR